MKRPDPLPSEESEMLILPNGTILVHNLTPTVAALLTELDPTDGAMLQRAGLGAAVSEPPASRV